MAEVIVTNHAKYRLSQREIDVHEAKRIATRGKVTETDSDGTITKMGLCSNGKNLVVVTIQQGKRLLLKTAYYAN